MILAKTIWLQSSDDESISIEISTECLPINLQDNWVFWELKRNMKSAPIIAKNSNGGTATEVDDVFTYAVDTTNRTVTATPNDDFIAYLASGTAYADDFYKNLVTDLKLFVGSPAQQNSPSETVTEISGPRGLITLTMEGGIYACTSLSFTYESGLDTYITKMLPAFEGSLITYADTAMGLTPHLVYSNVGCNALSVVNDRTNRRMVATLNPTLTSYMASHADFGSDFSTLAISIFAITTGIPSDVAMVGDAVTVTGPNGVITITVVGSFDAPESVTISYEAALSDRIAASFDNAKATFFAFVNAELGLAPFATYAFPLVPILTDVVVDAATNSVIVYLSASETGPLYGEYLQYLYVRNKINNKKESILHGVVGFLESFESNYPIVTYTTPELVAKQLRMTDANGSNLIFTEDTDPARSLVIEYIRQAETRIDREAKNSWKINTVTDELHDIPHPLGDLPLRDVVVNMSRSKIRPWDPSEGDSIYVFQTGTWVNYTNIAQEMQGDSWWIDNNIGQIHFNDFWPWFNSGQNRIKISYRWGDVQEEVYTDIQEACTKMVAIRLLQSEFNKIMLYNRSSNPINWDRTTTEWEKDIKEILAARKRKITAIVTR